MKVKIFASEYEKKNLEAVGELETEINGWLDQHPDIELVDLQQSITGGNLQVSDTKLIVTI